MATIDLETKDYVLTSLDAAFNDDVVQVVCQRLNIHRGKYWRDPTLGSRLYTLRRSKDLPRMLALAKQYADEALQDLLPDRLSSITTTAGQSVPSQIDIQIEITLLSGTQQTIQYFVAVGG